MTVVSEFDVTKVMSGNSWPWPYSPSVMYDTYRTIDPGTVLRVKQSNIMDSLDTVPVTVVSSLDTDN